MIRGRSENKNQGGMEKTRSKSKKKYLKKMSAPLPEKGRKIAPNWPKAKKSRDQLQMLYKVKMKIHILL